MLKIAMLKGNHHVLHMGSLVGGGGGGGGGGGLVPTSALGRSAVRSPAYTGVLNRIQSISSLVANQIPIHQWMWIETIRIGGHSHSRRIWPNEN